MRFRTLIEVAVLVLGCAIAAQADNIVSYPTGSGTVPFISGTPTTGHCGQWASATAIGDSGAACGGNAIYTHTLTAGTSATLTVNSSSTAAIDVNYETPTGNLTLTTPASTGMADGEELLVETINTGSAYTVTFSGGAGVTLKTIVPGDSNSTPGQVCTPPATGDTWYRWQWDNSGSRATLTLMGCGPNPPVALSLAQLANVDNVTSQTVSSATNIAPTAGFLVTDDTITLGASATMTLTAASTAGQVLNITICESSSGYTPTFSVGSLSATNINSVGTPFPAFTVAANHCGDMSIKYVTTTSIQVVGGAP